MEILAVVVVEAAIVEVVEDDGANPVASKMIVYVHTD